MQSGLLPQNSATIKTELLRKTMAAYLFCSDIAYHEDKIKREPTNVNLWGPDHHGYIERVKSAMKL